MSSMSGSQVSARGETDALLHAAGELVDGVALEVRQPDQGQVVPRPGPALGPRHPLELEPDLGVLDHVEPRKQACFWKTTPRSRPGPVTGVPLFRTAPEVGERNPAMTLRSVVLSAAGSSEGNHELVLLELEVHVLERLDAPEPLQGRELHRDVSEGDDRGHGPMTTRGRTRRSMPGFMCRHSASSGTRVRRDPLRPDRRVTPDPAGAAIIEPDGRRSAPAVQHHLRELRVAESA